MYFWDTLYDWTHTSDNERKRDEYKKLVNYLNKKISKADDLYNNLVSGCKIENNIMKGTVGTLDTTAGDASGVLASMYDTKFNIYDGETEKLLTYYKNMIASFRSSLAAAQSKYEYYVEQCRIEDEERRRRIREEEEREANARREAEQAKSLSK